MTDLERHERSLVPTDWTCAPAPESTDNMNTSRVGNLGLSDAEEDAIVSFMQTLSDGFMSREQ